MKFPLFLILLYLLVAPAAAEVLFFEDFEDGVADGFLPLQGEWEVIEGQYRCHVEGFELDGSSIFGQPEWADYQLDFDMMVHGAVNHRCQFRQQSIGDFYRFTLRATPYGQVRLSKTQDGVYEELFILDGYPWTTGTWYHITIFVQGPLISAFVDGSHLLSYLDVSDPLAQFHHLSRPFVAQDNG